MIFARSYDTLAVMEPKQNLKAFGKGKGKGKCGKGGKKSPAKRTASPDLLTSSRFAWNDDDIVIDSQFPMTEPQAPLG